MTTSTLNSTFVNSTSREAWDEPLENHSVAYWVVKIIIAIATIFGNGFVIFLITTRRKLHTTDNWFILSLSLSDLFIGAYVTPSELFCDLLKLCTRKEIASIAIPNYFIISSICNLCALTADRYIAILYPLRYVMLMTSSRVKQLIFIAWFIPLLVAIAMLLPFISPTFIIADRYLTILWIILITFVPSITLILIYLRIYIVVKKQQKQNTQLRYLSAVSLNNVREGKRSRDRSSVKVLGVVILFFILCWQPSVYRSICENFNQCHVTLPIKQFARVLILLNSAINFVVYALLKRDIRKEFLKICKSVVRKRNQSHSSTISGQSASSGLSATSVRYCNQISGSRRVHMITGSSRTLDCTDVTDDNG